MAVMARQQALALSESLRTARAAVRGASGGLATSFLKRHLVAAIERRPEARVDYLEFFEPETLVPVRRVRPGVHMALAVYVGKTRLIDNALL